MRVRLAQPDDLHTVVQLRQDATAWLASKGSDQWATDWPDTETMLAGFEHDLQAGETWFAVASAHQVVACITINDRTHDGLWTPEETATALFVHRLTLARRAAGRGVGAYLLDFADYQTEQAKRRWLRLDAWTTNNDLHKYYTRQGFRHVRTVANHYSPSAACFERQTSPQRSAPFTSG